MLSTNMGFAINAHLCGGKVVEASITIGMRYEHCGMEESDETTTCTEHDADAKRLKAKSCCENQHHFAELDGSVEKPQLAFQLLQIPVFILPTYFTQTVYKAERTTNRPALNYQPPPDSNPQALLQVYQL